MMERLRPATGPRISNTIGSGDAWFVACCCCQCPLNGWGNKGIRRRCSYRFQQTLHPAGDSADTYRCLAQPCKRSWEQQQLGGLGTLEGSSETARAGTDGVCSEANIRVWGVGGFWSASTDSQEIHDIDRSRRSSLPGLGPHLAWMTPNHAYFITSCRVFHLLLGRIVCSVRWGVICGWVSW